MACRRVHKNPISRVRHLFRHSQEGGGRERHTHDQLSNLEAEQILGRLSPHACQHHLTATTVLISRNPCLCQIYRVGPSLGFRDPQMPIPTHTTHQDSNAPVWSHPAPSRLHRPPHLISSPSHLIFQDCRTLDDPETLIFRQGTSLLQQIPRFSHQK